MVGGTIFHRDVIQREISRALVLNLSGKTRCSGTAEEIFVLDNAFALIEGPARHADLQLYNAHLWLRFRFSFA